MSEPLGRPVAKRAATRREDDATHTGLRVALEALEDGVVLAVDGEELSAVFFRGGHDELAGEDEDFLRGEREVLAGGERGERGVEAGGADDGDQHDVRFGQLREFDESGKSADEAGAGGKCSDVGASGGERGVVKHPDVAHAELAGDAGEFLPIGTGGDADEFELVAVRREHAKRVFADGAGGAEEDDAFAGGDGFHRTSGQPE